ncbi:MAG: ABC transporter ATP-binding protein [Actinomycetia bacterium]|nr:ABC transporter ATP-binding protein [Actinomycetes bacterium]
MSEPLLDVRDLRVSFRTRGGLVTAVDGISFTVGRGEVVGLVGESGSGKSVSMLTVLRLIDNPNCVIEGEVLFKGQNLLELEGEVLRKIRGQEIAMVFQDPMTALTPVYTAGWHISEQIRAHEKVSKKAAMDRAVQLLEAVGIPNAPERVNSYPHEFSGGMRQRVVIAMALSCNPSLLIADEPTTALDVTIQAQILELLRVLQKEFGSSILLITHDMGVVSQMSDRVLVMYGGRLGAAGPRREVMRDPLHPYTWGLMGAIPPTDGSRAARLNAIPGTPISPADADRDRCLFAPRCRFATDACRPQPPLIAHKPDHADACVLPYAERPALRVQAISPLGVRA